MYHSSEQTEEASRAYRDARDYFDSLPRATSEELDSLACVAAMCSVPDTGIAASTQDAAESRRNMDLAIDSLRKAVASGFNDVKTVKTDPDLDSIRSRPDFKALIADLEGKAAQVGSPATAPSAHAGLNKRAIEATQLHSVGVAQTELGQFDVALASLLKARELRETLVREGPSNQKNLSDLAMTLIAIGQLQVKRNSWSEARGSDPFLSAHAAIPVVVVSACLSRWFQRPAL